MVNDFVTSHYFKAILKIITAYFTMKHDLESFFSYQIYKHIDKKVIFFSFYQQNWSLF